MKTQKIAIDKLIPDPDNARKHSEKNLKAIRGSISQFGQVEPIVVQQDTMRVIGGNGRLEAFKELGFSEVDVVLVDLDNVKAKALALALNKTAELAEWDDEILLSQLEMLEEMDFDIGDIGFEEVTPDFDFKDPGDPSESKPDDNKLTVTCESLEAKDKLFNELNDRGFKVK